MNNRSLLFAALMAAAAAAHAQIRLPSLPNLGASSLSQNLDQVGTRSLGSLSELRQRQIERLVENNRRLIDTDPDGQPVVRSEVLALGVSAETLAKLLAEGFMVLREEAIASPDLHVTVLRAPANLSTRKALRRLREADPGGLYDYNHIYLGAQVSAGPAPTRELGLRASVPGFRVGLIDSGVDAHHPAFGASSIHSWGCGGTPVAATHGTAVASLLVSHANAELFAADVYCGAPTGGSLDAMAGAFRWMTEQRVAVINVSLVGPKNALLEIIVRSLLERGYVIVAAVGNDGPAAPPLYPAAYPGVVGVTAVDGHRQVLIEAGRGPQVMFAALGADIRAAGLNHDYVSVRGTSYAAPAVAALLAARVSTPDHEAALAAIDDLAQHAIHLGGVGRNLTYGYGLAAAENR